MKLNKPIKIWGFPTFKKIPWAFRYTKNYWRYETACKIFGHKPPIENPAEDYSWIKSFTCTRCVKNAFMWDRWQTHFSIGRARDRMDPGWYYFMFGIYKLLQDPEEGVQLKSQQYKGFMLAFRFWLPFERA